MARDVRAMASARNDLAEIFIDYSLACWAKGAVSQSRIRGATAPTLHKGFSRDDCSDVFDHYLTITGAWGGGEEDTNVDLWGQTTCYKGNETGATESNKTYEVRETLVEALTLRRWLIAERTQFRTLHFTLGPAAYSYAWFEDARLNSFDFSIHVETGTGEQDLFTRLKHALLNAKTEQEQLAALDAAIRTDTQIKTAYLHIIKCLDAWLADGLEVSSIANAQALLLNKMAASAASTARRAIGESRKGGAGIKQATLKVLSGGGTTDPNVAYAASTIRAAAPFLDAAHSALHEWPAWTQDALRCSADATLASQIAVLWNTKGSRRLVVRRLLVRCFSDEPVHYVADLGVPGVNEHNLYVGDHSAEQVSAVVGKLAPLYEAAGCRTAKALTERLGRSASQDILRSSLESEVQNGTSIRPVMDYLRSALSHIATFESIAAAGLPTPISYQRRFSKHRIGPYTNLVAIRRSKDDRVIAVLKGKYFRGPEFPRRAKEEGYVALTARNDFLGGVFQEVYPKLPFIMFVDMDQTLTPPDFAVRRLSHWGWDVYFSLDSLKSMLRSL